MKFHLVKLLLFLSLAASFMLLLKEDISPVRMPAARSRAGNDNGLCKYNASATKPLQSIRPAREELLAAQQEPGKAWPRHGEWPRLCCCHGRWGCSTPFGSPSAWAVMHSREWPAREESAGSAHTSGRLGEAKCGYWFGICDSRSLTPWFPRVTSVPQAPSHQPLRSWKSVGLPCFRAWPCFSWPHLQTLTDQNSAT